MAQCKKNGGVLAALKGIVDGPDAMVDLSGVSNLREEKAPSEEAKDHKSEHPQQDAA